MPLRTKLHKALSKAWRPLGRARRSRGFGVHSPFAFRFITFVLRDRRSCYYAYPAIRRLPDGRRDFRWLSCLFRVICDRRPGIIITGCTLTQSEQAVIAMADSRLSIISSHEAGMSRLNGQRVMLYARTVSPELTELARTILSGPDATICLSAPTPGTTSAITAGLDHIMTFSSPGKTIIVSRRGLPSQSFDINF